MPRGLSRYVRDFIRNWREYDAPLRTKVGLTIRNRIKPVTWLRPECCGHPGEPGC